MKNKVVLWGENASNEKILIALELLEKESKVNIYTFSLEVASEEFFQKLSTEWRDGKPLEFPQHTLIERPLSISENLLPDDIKVVKTELITRAQMEWQVVVLSSKLYELYKDEIDEIKGKIDALTDYDDKLWQEAKAFWTKVQDKVQDQTLFREHSNILKERTNTLFEKLKAMRKAIQSEYEKESKDFTTTLMNEINEVDEKLGKGMSLKPLFEQMKAIQTKYYQSKLSREDRKTVWDKLDATFKALKDQKPGGGSGNNNSGEKLQARYGGLVETIKTMEKSIARDKQDYDFQLKKIEQTEGQLEMQIRQAKLKMLQERISSKDAKLQDMSKIKVELEGKISKEEVKKANQDKTDQAKEIVKQKIAGDIEKNIEERETMADLLENAASKIKNNKKGNKKSDNLLGAIVETLSETIEDVVDTVKAVAEVVEDRVDEIKDQLENQAEVVMDKVEKVMDQAEEKIDATVESITSEEDKTDIAEEGKSETSVDEDKKEA